MDYESIFYPEGFESRLRNVATGETLVEAFSPKDWRVGTIAILLWDAADEIARLKEKSGLPAKPKFDKRAYQRNYMRQRRANV